jgi:hypothetical protein
MLCMYFSVLASVNILNEVSNDMLNELCRIYCAAECEFDTGLSQAQLSYCHYRQCVCRDFYRQRRGPCA